ncbi:hypothetical protein CKK33_18165 [Mucilaginibacter sp. MD40]|uniref:helix-turn-helix domain-containing protein n=1 Tax=Mucilaginibacter sp. MD40 TaxID=2029590 RepID=UPI000BACE8A7|nr:helix-turn-helix domain-containing protein [Mucilaginibacter sp. MD40]PAW95322.1 hypothetical protein CKK33_18165 [Mucilaginibacter sp. MD40]
MASQTEGNNILKGQQLSMVTFVNQFLTLVTDAVQESVDKAAKNIIAELSQQKTTHPGVDNLNDGYITREQVADLLQISYPTLHRYQCQGLIPVVRIGRKCLYNKTEVLDSLKNVSRKKGRQLNKK